MAWGTPIVDHPPSGFASYVDFNRIEADISWLAGGDDNIALSSRDANPYALAKRDSAGSIAFNGIAAATVGVSGALTALTFNGATIGATTFNGATINAGAISGASLGVSGAISVGNWLSVSSYISAGGAISGASLSVSGAISGGAISGASITLSGGFGCNGKAAQGTYSVGLLPTIFEQSISGMVNNERSGIGFFNNSDAAAFVAVIEHIRIALVNCGITT